MAHFYSSSNFGGFEYKGYGHLGTCNDFNFAEWNGLLGIVSSVSLGKDASTCLLYTEPGCAGSYTAMYSNVAALKNTNIASFQCYGAGSPSPPDSGYGYGGYNGYGPPSTPSTSPKSATSNGIVFSTSSSSKSKPSYSVPLPSTLSSSLYGLIVAPTLPPLPPLPTLSPTVYSAPTVPSSSNAESGGILVTPTPTPMSNPTSISPLPPLSTLYPSIPTSIYGQPIPSPSSTEESGGGFLVPTPISSIYSSLSPGFSASSLAYGGPSGTPASASTTLRPIYVSSSQIYPTYGEYNYGYF